MRTLWLLRHAKARAGDRDSSDHERGLEERGLRDAERMGRHLANRGFAPQWTVCSTAVRARQTLEALARGLDRELEGELDRDLYLASASELASRLRHVPDDVSSVLFVGHNPGIAELAAQLARRGDAEARKALDEKFPTCALAELRLETPRWRDLSGGAELSSYRTPKRVEAAERDSSG